MVGATLRFLRDFADTPFGEWRFEVEAKRSDRWITNLTNTMCW